ncbi:MAG: hypothetical protein R3Y32_06315 [Bacillota bacterium]
MKVWELKKGFAFLKVFKTHLAHWHFKKLSLFLVGYNPHKKARAFLGIKILKYKFFRVEKAKPFHSPMGSA